MVDAAGHARADVVGRTGPVMTIDPRVIDWILAPPEPAARWMVHAHVLEQPSPFATARLLQVLGRFDDLVSTVCATRRRRWMSPR